MYDFISPYTTKYIKLNYTLHFTVLRGIQYTINTLHTKLHSTLNYTTHYYISQYLLKKLISPVLIFGPLIEDFPPDDPYAINNAEIYHPNSMYIYIYKIGT